LKTALERHDLVDDITEENGKLLVHLKEAMDAAEINAYLFSQNITLCHLVKRKNSLEEQFLELTNNHQSSKNN